MLRQIVSYPNPSLTAVTRNVSFPLTQETADLIADLLETMYHHKACGIGANQVGSDARVCVVDLEVCGLRGEALVFINPEILSRSSDTDRVQEACLSLPGLSYAVSRASKVTVRYQDQAGEVHTLDADGFYGRAIQHEIDHLDGITILEHLGRTGKQMALKRLRKLRSYGRVQKTAA